MRGEERGKGWEIGKRGERESARDGKERGAWEGERWEREESVRGWERKEER